MSNHLRYVLVYYTNLDFLMSILIHYLYYCIIWYHTNLSTCSQSRYRHTLMGMPQTDSTDYANEQKSSNDN